MIGVDGEDAREETRRRPVDVLGPVRGGVAVLEDLVAAGVLQREEREHRPAQDLVDLEARVVEVAVLDRGGPLPARGVLQVGQVSAESHSVGKQRRGDRDRGDDDGRRGLPGVGCGSVRRWAVCGPTSGGRARRHPAFDLVRIGCDTGRAMPVPAWLYSAILLPFIDLMPITLKESQPGRLVPIQSASTRYIQLDTISLLPPASATVGWMVSNTTQVSNCSFYLEGGWLYGADLFEARQGGMGIKPCCC